MFRNKLMQILVVIALLAGFGGRVDVVMAAPPPTQPVLGNLNAANPTWNRISDRIGNPDSVNDNLPYEVLEISGSGDLIVTAEHPTQFDSFLALYSAFDPSAPQANLLAADDDSAGYPHARLVKNGLAPGKYYLVITSYSGGSDSVLPRYGNYLLHMDGAFTVVPQATLTTLVVTPALAAAGQEITLTATVTKASGYAMTVGEVAFRAELAVTLGRAMLDGNGQATIKVSSLAPGGHGITANFLGAVNYLPSTSAPKPVTVIQPPLTTPASAVTSTTAVLNGMVNAMGQNTTVSFEYGKDNTYSSVSATPASVSGTTDTPVSVAIADLTPETTYHYRVVVSSSGLTFYGSDIVFKTGARLTVTRDGDGTGSIAAISGCSLSWNSNVGSCSPVIGDAVEFRIIPASGSYVVTPVGGSCGGSGSGNPLDPVNGLTYSTAPQAADCAVAVTFSRMPAYNVTISNAVSNQGFWDKNSWIPTGSGSNVNIADINAKLLAGEAVIATNSAAGEEGDIIVKDAVSWNSGLLKLSAFRNIKVNAVMTAEGVSNLNLETVSGSVITGLDGSGFYGKVDFPNRIETDLFSLVSGYLTINSEKYTVISSLGASGSWTPVDLQGISGDCNSIAGRYALGADINAAETAGWSGSFFPLGLECTFAGAFDGLGHKVSDLTISGYWSAGLFARTEATSMIRNVGLAGGSIAGETYVGGLVGSNLGTISNSYSSATVNGIDYVGGLVGQNDGNIGYSYSRGIVTGSGSYSGGLVGWNHSGPISNSFSSGAVSGNKYVGGLVGENYVVANNCQISDSFSSSIVHGFSEVGGLAGFNWGDYSNVYSSGAVSATIGNNVGGLLGWSNAGTVTSGFWDMDTSGQSTSGGGIGKTTAELQQIATFTADGIKWSIAGDDTAANAGTVWRILEGNTYPMLRSFLSLQTISGFTPPANATHGDGPISLSATASSGLPVVFSVASGPGSISGNQLNISAAGTINLVASQPGNALFSAATDVTASIVVASPPRLIVAVGGTGTGTITSVPPGISCQKSVSGNNVTCESRFYGTVELHATVSFPSAFSGWGGVGTCPGLGTVCSVTMTGDQTVAASFKAVPLIQIGETPYTTIQEAYDAATDQAEIKLLDTGVAGTLNAHKNITVKLNGGFNLGYNVNAGTTTVTAPLAIRQGMLVVDKIVIR